MWHPNSWQTATRSKYVCQDGDIDVSRRAFCFYGIACRSQYRQGVCLMVCVLHSVKMEERKVDARKGEVTETTLQTFIKILRPSRHRVRWPVFSLAAAGPLPRDQTMGFKGLWDQRSLGVLKSFPPSRFSKKCFKEKVPERGQAHWLSPPQLCPPVTSAAPSFCPRYEQD